MKPLFMAAALLLPPLSCKHRPGGSCDAGEARCLDRTRAIVCEDGRFVETPCRGQAGCLTVQESTSCDITGNRAGDACAKPDEGVAVCVAKDAMLACHGGKFERVPCRGSKGCEMGGDRANCDQSIAGVGEACTKPDAKACSVDATSVLSCGEGTMRVLYACRGTSGCSAKSGKLSCDQTIARLGDACDKGLDGHIACSEDKKALVVCDGQRFVSSERCKSGALCIVSGQSTSCAKR